MAFLRPGGSASSVDQSEWKEVMPITTSVTESTPKAGDIGVHRFSFRNPI